MLDRNADLSGLEACLYEPMKRVALIGEVPINDDDLKLMAARLRECLVAKGLGPGTEYLSERGSRVVTCFLVHLGVREYREGRFWGAVSKALGLDLSTNLQDQWGQVVESMIKIHRLEPFFDPIEGKGLRYVTPILGHGGIPDYCLEDFFEKLLIPVARGRLTYDGDVEHLLREWEDRPSDFQTADKPIHRFLRHGGNVARDFLDRCLEMVEAFDGDRLDGFDGFGLPQQVVDRFREWAASQGPTSRGRSAHVSSGPRYQRPELYLDPASMGLRLVIPCQSISLAEAERGRLTVFVRRDSGGQEFELRPISVNGTVDTAVVELPLRRSFAKLNVALRAGHSDLRNWDFEGIASDRPWMAFDGETYQLLSERPLHRNDIWLLAPGAMVLEGHPASDEFPIWGDFRAHRVDLAASVAWRLQEGQSGSDRSFAIESVATIRPFLEGSRPPSGPAISSPGCDHLFVGGSPELVIPAGCSGLGGWRGATLSVRSLDGEILPSPEWRFPLSDLVGEWPKSDQPIRLDLGAPPLSLETGRFILKLQGRLGQDEAYRIAVVPEMVIDCPDEFAFDEGLGGSPVNTIRILVPPGSQIEALIETDGLWEDGLYRIDLAPRQRIANLMVNGVPLRIEIPRIEWTFRPNEEAALRYDSQPIEIDLQELENAPEPILDLRTSGNCPAGRLLIDPGGQSQAVNWRQGRASISLKAYLDTIRAAHGPLVSLKLAMDGPVGDERGVEVLRIRRRWGCQLRSIETDVESGKRALFLAWDDHVPLPNRVIRFWRGSAGPEHEIPVGDGVEEIADEEITEERLPTGRYLLEFDVQLEDDWCSPAKPDLFKVGVQVIRLDASSAEILGSPAGRLDALIGALDSRAHIDLVLRDRVIGDILAEPSIAKRALQDRGWASLKPLFASESRGSDCEGDIEEIYGAICWSGPEFAVAFLRGLWHANAELECQEGDVLDIELDDGSEHPVAIHYRAKSQNDVRKNRPPRKRRFDGRVDEGRKCVVAASWHCVRPYDWSPEIKRFILSRFQRGLDSGAALCPADVRCRIEEMGRHAFLSDPDVYLKALIDADQDLSR